MEKLLLSWVDTRLPLFFAYSQKTLLKYGKALLLLFLFLFTASYAQAQVVVTTTATGGTDISADNAANSLGGGTFTTLGDIVISETSMTNFRASQTLTIVAPTGWQFGNGGITNTVTGDNGSQNVSIGVITYTSTTLSIPINVTGTNKRDIIRLIGVRVKANSGADIPASGILTASFTATSPASSIGITNTTSLGALSQKVGQVSKLAITTQPSSTTYGSAIGTSVVKSQDQFGNLSTTNLPSNLNVTAIISSGTGTLNNNVLNIGTTGTNGTVTFSNLNATTAGVKRITFSAPGLTSAISNEFTVNQRPLTVTASAQSKIYDGNNVATASLTNNALSGDVVVATAGQALFSDKHVGTGKTVSISGITIGGAAAGNYSLSSTNATTTASITAKSIALEGVSAETKVYDGTTSASLTGTPSFNSAISGDDVSVDLNAMTATFDTKAVGTNKQIIISNPTAALRGGDAGNYTLTTNVKGAITPLAIVGEVTVANKVYDKTTAATISSRTLQGEISGDVVSYIGGTATFDNENVGTGKTVAVSGLGLTGADAGNYTVNTTATATADITKRAIVLTVNAADKAYDGTTSAEATISSNIISGDNLTVEYGSAVFASKAVGTHTVTVSGISFVGPDQDNYAIPDGGEATGTASITKKALVMSNASADDKVYDRTNAAIISGDLNGIIPGDEVTVNHAGAFASINVGNNIQVNVVSTLSGADAGNYTIAQPSGLVADITPKELTVLNAAALGKVYNAKRATTITGTLDGMIAPDVVTLVGTGNFQSSEVGTRNVTSTSTLGGASAGNYTLVQPTNLSATITPKPLSIGSILAQSKIYDGNINATVTGTLGGVEADDVNDVTLQFSGTFSDPNVGTNKAVTANATLTGDKAFNYSLTQPVGLTANITAKQLTVSGITAVSRVYDRTTVATLQGTPVLSGLQDGEAVDFNMAGLTASFATKTVGNNKAVTVTGNPLTGPNAGNYSLAQISGLTASITPLALTISGAVANNKVYDGNTSATFAGTLTGVILNDVVALNKVANFATPNVGNNIAVTSTSTLTGGDATNYSLTQPTGLAANITGKVLTIANAAAANKVYDGNNVATITGTLSGLAPGDNVTLNLSGTFAQVNVGTGITVTSTSTITGPQSTNYTFNQPTNLTANITPRPLTISNIKAQDKIYDKTTAATISATLGNVVPGDEVIWNGVGTFASFRVNRQNQADTPKPISVTYNSYTLSGAQSSNYTVSFATPTGLSAIINPLKLTPVVAASYEFEYGSSTQGQLVISTNGLIGVISPDHVQLYITVNFPNVNVGDYSGVVVGLSLGSTDKDNYYISPTTANVNIKITPKALTITATGPTRVYDGTDIAVLNLTDNRINADDITITYTSAKFNNKNVGTNKPITIAGLAISGTKAANYVLTNPPVATTGAITRKPLMVTGLTANEKVYDGLRDVLGFTGTVAMVGKVDGDDITLNGQPTGLCDNKDAGDRLVTLSGLTHSGVDAGNYALTMPAGMTMRITPKTVIGSFVAEDKLWDGNTNAAVSSFTIVDKITGDDVSFTGVARFLDSEMGIDKPVVFDITTASLTGLQKANYVLGSINNAVADIINPLPVTLVSFNAKTQNNQVVLSWTTATEIDNDYFQIERSADGKNFTAIGKVKGNGNSNTLLNYTFKDASPLVATAYYRLKQVDFNGKFEYSKVVSLQQKGAVVTSVAIKAYPNPTNDLLNLDLSHLSEAKIKIQVIGLDGHIVKAFEVQGGKVQSLDMTELAAGSYVVKLTGPEVNTFQRIVKR
ncbi:YDG domain-containing protein [Rufibacter sp. DG15C]|uniref:YDG domain-containing protein n=1 Tax=Rufibacter sp. DG15C TaxID=1379909 RepID=UPI00083655E5|nr:YDG domain-containing protein [Rufibacter sp. DG15C]